MKTVIISDLHFGSWAGNDLLKHRFALDLLRPRLRTADRLVVLGDFFEICFQSMPAAFDASLPFLRMVAEEMPGKEFVFVPGNHDHHLIVRSLEDVVEARIATGADADTAWEQVKGQHFVERFLQRQLPEMQITIAYPTYEIGDILCTHGHYLDTHIRGSLPHWLMRTAAWKMSGGKRSDELTLVDYESLTTPLYELYYQIAQLPRGIAAQSTIWLQLRGITRFLHATRRGGREVVKAVRWGAGKAGQALQRKHAGEDLPVEQPPTSEVETLESSELELLEAFEKVCKNLGWENKTIVVGHTHQPIRAARIPNSNNVFYNTGSWFYDKPQAKKKAYMERAWPGTAIEITEIPGQEPVIELVALLREYNPMMLMREMNLN